MLDALGKSHATEWRPIAEAEPNKVHLVARQNPFGTWVIQLAHFITRYTEESTEDFSEYCEEKDAYYTPMGWYEMCYEHDEYGSMKMNTDPTHYMPLPPTPETKE